MTLNISHEADIVRRMCGYPDSTEIPTSQIEDIYRSEALRWLNRRRPGVGLTYFLTVGNQQDYAVKPANAFNVTEVWWQTQGADVFSPDLSYLPSSMTMANAFAGFSVFDNPAIANEFYKKLSEYDYLFKGSGWETPDGKIRLEPVPSGDDDKVFFEYSYPRWNDAVNIPNQYREGVNGYVSGCVMRVLAIRRGNVVSGKNFSSGGGAKEEKFYTEFMAEAEAQVPNLDQSIYRG